MATESYLETVGLVQVDLIDPVPVIIFIQVAENIGAHGTRRGGNTGGIASPPIEGEVRVPAIGAYLSRSDRIIALVATGNVVEIHFAVGTIVQIGKVERGAQPIDNPWRGRHTLCGFLHAIGAVGFARIHTAVGVVAIPRHLVGRGHPVRQVCIEAGVLQEISSAGPAAYTLVLGGVTTLGRLRRAIRVANALDAGMSSGVAIRKVALAIGAAVALLAASPYTYGII